MEAKVLQITNSYVVMAVYQNGRFIGQYNVPFTNVKQQNIKVGQEYTVTQVSETELNFWLK